MVGNIKMRIIESSEMISHRDVYKCLWMCRDFELQHLWQRSVFLTAFLLACFTAYVRLAVAMIGKTESVDNRWIVNGAAFGICIVGTVLSLLWIMMAKGSKAWYERYENAIKAFVEEYPEAFEGDLDKLEGFEWQNLSTYQKPDVSNWLWNAKGGAYSPSKINAAIGYVSLVVWIVLAFVHLAIAGTSDMRPNELVVLKTMVSDPPEMMLCFLVVLLGFWVFVRANLKSGCLGED